MSENVFAYGSNMCSGRFRDYGVLPEGKGRAALLADYRLLFNKKSMKDGSGKANVEPHVGGQVWGVLYTVSDSDLKRLDAGEIGYSKTADPAEMQQLTSANPKWTLEGSCGYVYRSAPAAPQPFFRSYNPATGGHLYTLNITEHDNATTVDGYRADGISGYLWPTGAQAGTTQLNRYYNAGANDHFYTTAAAGPAGYNAEGPVGWVSSAAVAGLTTPMHRLVGNFANDFLVLAPAQGLTGNSNFVMTSQFAEGLAHPILGIDVELDISTALTVGSVDFGDLGCSLQLNGYSPQGFNSAWQQYCIYLDNKTLMWEIQNWIAGTDANPYSPSFVRAGGELAALTANALPAGLRLRTVLIYDAYGFVLGANFFAYQGSTTIGQAQMLIQNIAGPAVSGIAFGSAPILAFQLLLVGTGGDSTTTFQAGGSGTLRYTATSPLQATTQLPTNVGFHVTGTGENSTITYGPVAATFSKTHTQTVSV